MIRIKLAVTSPEQWPDRSCNGVDRELFFAKRGTDAEAEAIALCERCPRLGACAEWARGAGLTDCVVAAVRMPDAGDSRKAANAKLARVAADAQERVAA